MSQTSTLSWNEIDDYCRIICQKIIVSGYCPDIIVGIQRGGCIPAVILSHNLGISNFCAFGIRTTSSNDIRALRQKPEVYGTSILERVNSKKVLIVDDATDTGSTLLIAKNEIFKFSPLDCKSAVIIWDGDISKKCTADYYATHTPNWVIFPWEI